MKPISFLILLFLLCGSTFGISVKFNNKTDKDLVIHTAQYGETPQLHEASNLSKVIEIKKHSSAQIFLYETGSWLRWKAESKDGNTVQTGTINLNPVANKQHIIDISPLPVSNSGPSPNTQ